MSYALGIDLGGSSVKAVLVRSSGETVQRERLDFDAARPMEWAAGIRKLVERLSARAGGVPVALGLAAPGLAAADGRSIAHMPGRLEGLTNLDWTGYLARAHPVPVLNDAHAALLGERWLGAARDLNNVIMLTLGTGVGGAAMVDGRLLRGHLGRAGHLGHACVDLHGPPDICGMPGSLEVAIGNCTIQERSAGRFATTHALIAAAEAGDRAATALWLEAVRALACAVASFVNILDPEAVILGGGIARSGATLSGPLGRFLDRFEWRPGGRAVRLLPAQLGEFAGAFGAAGNGLQAAVLPHEGGGGAARQE